MIKQGLTFPGHPREQENGAAMKEQEINRHWRKILDTMSEGLMLIGTDGTILSVNRAFERLLGYTAGEVVGRPCSILNCDACERLMEKGQKEWLS